MKISNQEIIPGRYTIVPRTLIFMTHQKRVLLLKGAPQKRLWADLYNGLGGHIECGEDVLSAGHRELIEETGLSDVRLWLCGIITIDTGKEMGIGIFVLRGETDQIMVTPSEEGIPEWVDFDQINQIPLVEDLTILLPRILAMRLSDTPFSAHYHAIPGESLNISFYS